LDKDSRATLNILDIFAFLIEWRRIWIPAALICALAMGIYAFVATPLFRSVAIVRGVEGQSNNFGSILASKLSGLGNIAGFAAGLGEVRGDYYLLILRSRSLSEKVINEFDLRREWKLESAPLEVVIEKLAGKTYFKYFAATNTVSIQVDDPDAERAKRMCEFFIRELDSRNQQNESIRARKEREFSEQRLAQARNELFALEDSMSAFQKRTGIFNLEEQAKATASAYAAIQAERFVARAEYEMKAKLFEGDNPELSLALMKLAGIDSSIKSLSSPSSDAERSFLLHLDRASEDGKTYLRLYRDIEISSIVMTLLTQQFEQAKLAEARNTPTMAVVEPPAAGTKRVAPKRGMLVGMGAALGFILSLLFAGVVSTIRRLRKPEHPNHASYQKLVASVRK